MQSLDYRILCQRCQEPTYQEIRYRSDNPFKLRDEAHSDDLMQALGESYPVVDQDHKIRVRKPKPQVGA